MQHTYTTVTTKLFMVYKCGYCNNGNVCLCHCVGIEFPYVPEVDTPLVCDMSSNFLTRPVDVSKVTYLSTNHLTSHTHSLSLLSMHLYMLGLRRMLGVPVLPW